MPTLALELTFIDMLKELKQSVRGGAAGVIVT